jgi:thiamine kinase-like enzyme
MIFFNFCKCHVFLRAEVDLHADYARLRSAIEAVAPQLPVVFSHNDLCIYNILADPATG